VHRAKNLGYRYVHGVAPLWEVVGSIATVPVIAPLAASFGESPMVGAVSSVGVAGAMAHPILKRRTPHPMLRRPTGDRVTDQKMLKEEAEKAAQAGDPILVDRATAAYLDMKGADPIDRNGLLAQALSRVYEDALTSIPAAPTPITAPLLARAIRTRQTMEKRNFRVAPSLLEREEAVRAKVGVAALADAMHKERVLWRDLRK
jgi:hypothetical protein